MSPVTTDATRERIIDAAEECFGRFGVAKTAVEDIAAAATPSRGRSGHRGTVTPASG